MSGDTRTQDAIGVRTTKQIVVERLGSGWQELDRLNDDAVDGIIILRKKGRDTGGLIFVQIKCGEGYRQKTAARAEYINVNVGSEYIEKHRPRWAAVPGPAILVFVDPSINPTKPPAWWVDLRSPAAYSAENKQVILVPKRQRFGDHSMGDLMQLCGGGPSDRNLPSIVATRHDVKTFTLSQPIKKWAWQYYKQWAAKDVASRSNPMIGEVFITRTGWRHISAKRRRSERIIQSWLLLGIAQRMIKEIHTSLGFGRVKRKENSDGTSMMIDHPIIRAQVIFPHRDRSVVQVVLERRRFFGSDLKETCGRTSFLSVYELRRGTS